MEVLAWHVTMRLKEDAVIAPSPTARRTLASIFHWHGQPVCLLAFAAADTHLHALVLCSREDAGEFARRVEITLQAHLDLHTGFAGAHFKPVRDQRHMERVFHYIHRQREHHGLHTDRFQDASSLSDFLGLRVGGGEMVQRALERLPRVTIAQMARESGLAGWIPILGPQQRVVGRGSWALQDLDLVEAGLAAIGGLASRRADLGRAKALVAKATEGQLNSAELARSLGCTESYALRLRKKKTRSASLAAAHRQLALRSAQVSLGQPGAT